MTCDYVKHRINHAIKELGNLQVSLRNSGYPLHFLVEYTDNNMISYRGWSFDTGSAAWEGRYYDFESWWLEEGKELEYWWLQAAEGVGIAVDHEEPVIENITQEQLEEEAIAYFAQMKIKVFLNL